MPRSRSVEGARFGGLLPAKPLQPTNGAKRNETNPLESLEPEATMHAQSLQSHCHAEAEGRRSSLPSGSPTKAFVSTGIMQRRTRARFSKQDSRPQTARFQRRTCAACSTHAKTHLKKPLLTRLDSDGAQSVQLPVPAHHGGPFFPTNRSRIDIR